MADQVRAYSWYYRGDKQGHQYAYRVEKGQYIYLHRWLCGLKKGDKLRVDHKDNQGLNCTRENMRVCTQRQNLWNIRKHKPNKAGFKGVYESKERYRRLRFRASIVVNGKAVHLGRFLTASEAAAAYNEAALRYFGEFAQVNALP